MTEPAILVADAIVDRLSAVEWDLATAFSRTYLDSLEAINDEQRRLWVMPADVTQQPDSRYPAAAEIHTTWLLFAARVPDASADTLDPLVDLTRAIRNHLAIWPLKKEDGFERYANAGIQTADLYDFEALSAHNLFVQLFGFRWRWTP